MEIAKKKRGENWSTEEKEILRTLIAQSAKILEDKSTKTNANNLKVKEWKNLTNKFNEITGKNRTDTEIKLAWKRMKLAAKANLSLHLKEQFLTGGGTKPPSPSPEDLQVMEIAPHDFVIEVNDFDSDAMIQNVITESEPIPGPSSQAQPGSIILLDEETPDPNVIKNEVIKPNKEIEEKWVDHTQKENVKYMPKITRKTGRKVFQNRSEEGRQAIVNSNLDFKKRQIEMLEVEHAYNKIISELKIKKLQLEIALLENQIKTKKDNASPEE